MRCVFTFTWFSKSHGKASSCLLSAFVHQKLQVRANACHFPHGTPVGSYGNKHQPFKLISLRSSCRSSSSGAWTWAMTALLVSQRVRCLRTWIIGDNKHAMACHSGNRLNGNGAPVQQRFWQQDVDPMLHSCREVVRSRRFKGHRSSQIPH